MLFLSIHADDPLAPNRRCIKAKTAKLKDPVHIDARKAEEESSMLGIKAAKTQLCKVSQIHFFTFASCNQLMNAFMCRTL